MGKSDYFEGFLVLLPGAPGHHFKHGHSFQAFVEGGNILGKAT
jgi:hypothetical protein